jgi:hypothetical protein
MSQAILISLLSTGTARTVSFRENSIPKFYKPRNHTNQLVLLSSVDR